MEQVVKRGPGRPRGFAPPRPETGRLISEVSPPLEISENAPETVHFVESPITRFTLFDMPEWGDWLCMRLDRQWPNKNRMFWQGKVNNITTSNDFLFIKNDDGVLLVMSPPHLMDDRPRAMEVLAWSKQAAPMKWEKERLSIIDNRAAQRSMLSLYRFAGDWVRKRGALYLIAGICTDMPIDRLEKALGGECADWVVVK
jgi:hypothetical protein